MHLSYSPMYVPKRGSSTDEYEDAFCPMDQSEGSSVSRFAIGDGATETSFSGLWARLLVQAYCKGEMDSGDQIPETLRTLQKQWKDQLTDRQLPWFAEHKMQMGAFAAFLGLTINSDVTNDSSGTWDAIASGDCCLVQVRGEVVKAAFPLSESAAFNSHPVLLSTDVQALAVAMDNLTTISGEWQSGDLFFLMTDALAAWFFKEYEKEGRPWVVLRDLEYEETKHFAPWVAGLRSNSEIRNDDVTLARIEID